MALDAPSTPNAANGFKTVFDTIVAPKEAFEQLRTTPTWGWALLVALVLTAGGSVVALPATQHALVQSWPATVAASPQLAAQTPDQQQASLKLVQSFTRFAWVVSPVILLIGALLQALLMTIVNAIGRGSGTFKTFWAVSMNVSVIGFGIGSILIGLIVLVRGADAFSTSAEIQRVIPSLALLVPQAGVKTAAFLGFINVVSLWAAWLIVTAMTVVARVPRVHAWVTGVLVLIAPALLVAPFAR